jgi:hypothetical protein
LAWGGCQLKEVSKRLGANVRGDYKKRRKKLLDRIQEIDKIVEDTTLESDLISERCKLEGELEKIMDDEESYWQRRGGEKWVLKRDNNTIFFTFVPTGGGGKRLSLRSNMRGQF